MQSSPAQTKVFDHVIYFLWFLSAAYFRLKERGKEEEREREREREREGGREREIGGEGGRERRKRYEILDNA